MTSHPLLDVLLGAADGRYPPVDGGVTILPGLPGGLRAVVALTGHAFIATPQTAEELADLELDGFGRALDPAALTRIADGRRVGVNDVILVGRATLGPTSIGPTDRWDDNPRVAYARSLRSDVVVHGDRRGFFTLARGLAGRPELSIELADPGSAPGVGRLFLGEALRVLAASAGAGAPLFAAVSPGNARSLRSFLAAGFLPVGSEVILVPS